MRISRCPETFKGTFNEFFQQCVEPNLPSPERVQAFDSLITAYMGSVDAHFILRYSKGMVRGVPIPTAAGHTILPADNSPGWWVHAKLLSDEPLDAPEVFFGNVPTHMFNIGKTPTLNKAGYHLAHIIPVKDGNLDWSKWTGEELRRRFLLNVHPCNWFLLAHDAGQWARQGQRRDIIEWVEAAYQRRYGDLYLDFRARIGCGDTLRQTTEAPPDYAVGTVSPESQTRKRSTTRRRIAATLVPSEKSDKSRLLANRPSICRRHLGQEKTLNMKIAGLIYRVPHDDLVAWAEAHTSIGGTISWREKGVYSWPKPSRLMLAFLSRYAVAE